MCYPETHVCIDICMHSFTYTRKLLQTLRMGILRTRHDGNQVHVIKKEKYVDRKVYIGNQSIVFLREFLQQINCCLNENNLHSPRVAIITSYRRNKHFAPKVKTIGRKNSYSRRAVSSPANVRRRWACSPPTRT